MKKQIWNRLLCLGMIGLLIVVLAACSETDSVTTNESNNLNNTNNTENTDSTDNDSNNTTTPSGAVVDLTISTFMPGPHPQHTEILEPFVQQIEKATDGRVTGTLYTANALGEANAQYDLVVNGVADMSMSLHGYTPGKFPLTGVTELPFMGENATDATKIFWGLNETFPEIAEEHEGTKIGWLFKNDPAQILTVDKPILSPEDLKGLKIRTPSASANGILESYGAIPVSMPMGDVYEGMQKGVVDGALAPASVITNFQLGDVTNYITKGNFYTSSIFVVINPNTWSEISQEDQTAIEEIIGEGMATKAAELYNVDADGGWDTATEAGIDIYEIPEEDLAIWKKPLEPLYEKWIEEMEEEGLPGKEVYDEAVRLRDQGV
ncbi:TRAP transporter substrate-binding protein [Salipaludibacillus neizhouensis]|uniref:TRAP transporter substrate-binding protein n=1 Tax=Salipaludibacillus neizhouensis TaxID=885475 RepID=A0A3A9KBU8_9BACI|nr:TRAP transporter substrate-binding protein [Salipaludibacillus neizhouensis]RKL67083.1 TRAP transporter substrate-binding protein [Salipaludibacillus neizhouensis]